MMPPRKNLLNYSITPAYGVNGVIKTYLGVYSYVPFTFLLLQIAETDSFRRKRMQVQC